MRTKQWQGLSAVIIATLSLLLAGTPLTPARADSPVFPSSSVTPGATNPQVTQSNIQSTICVSGYTATIRPSSAYTTSLKKKQLATTYSFYHDLKTGDFEEDHLISLEIGGSPTSPLNLWPEPYAGMAGARIKDQVENKVHDLVCSGVITLLSAQEQIASNWYLAYQKYVLYQSNIATPPSTIPTPTSSLPLNTPASAPTSASASPTPSRPTGATGKCKDGTYSYAMTHRGMCSGHLGVEAFYI